MKRPKHVRAELAQKKLFARFLLVDHGVCQNAEMLDGEIDKNAKGWKAARLSKVSRSILRLCIYEMLFVEDIPCLVSINEALELAKLYEDDKARPFINGVLNAVKNNAPVKEN